MTSPNSIIADLQAENAELRKQRDKLLSFAEEYVEAFENGMAGDSFLLRIANAAIASVKGCA